MTIRTLLFIAAMFPVLRSPGQSAAQWTAWGDTATARGDHYGASRLYAHALELEPGRMALQWRMAEACRLSHQYDKAVPMYEQVQRKDMGRTHPEALRWLGEMQLCTGHYDDAQRTWERVLQREKRKDSAVAQRARNALEGCRMAKAVADRIDTVAVEHLPQPVNSYDSEFGARPGPDSSLLFTSLRGQVNEEGEVEPGSDYRAAIFSTYLKDGRWTPPVQAVHEINGTGDNANAIWDPDGGLLYFTRREAGGPRRILRSVNGTEPSAVLALEGDVSQPAPVRIGNIDCLFYTRWTDGASSDIHCSCPEDRAMETRFNEALQTTVNTLGQETCPWFDVHSGQLWFSSDHLPGLGGFDIFICRWEAEGLSAPLNPGPPINGPANDLYPVFNGALREGWLTSNRAGSLAKKGETCCNDLYRFELPRQGPPPVVVEEPVTDAARRITSLREKLPVRLYFHNDEPEPRSTATTTAQTYAQTYHAYKARIPEYHGAWEGANEDTDEIDAFFRNQVDGGFALLGEFIDLLHQALDEGQRIRLVVRGFASPLAKSDYNVNLSLRRIRSMVNELRTRDNGAFIAYLDGTATNGGRLVIEPAPYGESRSVEGVSDVLDDLRGSVYSVAASRERRIEIEQVEVLAAMPLSTNEQDLGRLLQGETRTTTFLLRNTGTRTMTLLKIRADCGCTSATWEKATLLAGESTTVTVEFNGRAPEGPLRKTVTILTDGDPAEITLTITGTVEARP